MSKGGYICKTCGSWIPIEAHGTYCKERNTTPPEPSTTAEEFEKWFAKTWPEKSAPPATEKLAYLSGFDEGKRIGREEEMARTVRLLGKKDAEITTLKALLHDEAKDYAETIMKLCEECGVESIQDIGPKLAELKAEHDRLQEDLCEKVVSEGGALEATIAALQKQNEGMREVLVDMASHADEGGCEGYFGTKAREALAAADEKEKS